MLYYNHLIYKWFDQMTTICPKLAQFYTSKSNAFFSKKQIFIPRIWVFVQRMTQLEK